MNKKIFFKTDDNLKKYIQAEKKMLSDEKEMDKKRTIFFKKQFIKLLKNILLINKS